MHRESSLDSTYHRRQGRTSKACGPSPFLPLKENLIKRQQKEEKILSLQKQDQMKREMLKNREGEGNGDRDGDGEERNDHESPVGPSSPIANEEDEENGAIIGAYIHPMMLPLSDQSSISSGCHIISSTPKHAEESKESIKPKGKKRSNPSPSTSFHRSKKLSQPPTNYLISNERLMSLIRRMYSIVPEVVQKAIVLESIADTDITGASATEVPPSNVPTWVSSLFTSFITSPIESSLSLPNASNLSAAHEMNGLSLPDVLSVLYGIPGTTLIGDCKDALTLNSVYQTPNQPQLYHHQIQLFHLMQQLSASCNPIEPRPSYESSSLDYPERDSLRLAKYN